MTDHELNAIIIGHIFNILVFFLNSMGWIKTGSRFYILGLVAVLGSYGCAWMVESNFLVFLEKNNTTGSFFVDVSYISVSILAAASLVFWMMGAFFKQARKSV